MNFHLIRMVYDWYSFVCALEILDDDDDDDDDDLSLDDTKRLSYLR